MKTINQIILIVAFIAFTVGNFGYSQGPTTHTILLNVNTSEVLNTNLATTINFGQAAGISNEEFTIQVNRGDIIVWQAVSSNAPDTDEVRVTTIQHESGPNFFGSATLSDNLQTPGVVLGSISNGRPGEIQKYTLHFRVWNSGNPRGGTFVVDPKIQINN